MVIVMVQFIALVVLDVAALRWGAESTEGLDSSERERRRQWGAFMCSLYLRRMSSWIDHKHQLCIL